MNTARDCVVLTFVYVQVHYMNVCLYFHCSLVPPGCNVSVCAAAHMWLISSCGAKEENYSRLTVYLQ